MLYKNRKTTVQQHQNNDNCDKQQQQHKAFISFMRF